MRVWLRRVLWLCLGLLGFVVVVLAAIALALAIPKVREAAVRAALDPVNSMLAGHLEVGRTGRLSPWGATFEDVRVYGAEGELQGHVGSLEVNLEPLALLSGELRFGSLCIDDLQARLGSLESPEGVIAALTPVEDEPSTEDAGGGTFDIVVDDLMVRDAQVRGQLRGKTLRVDIDSLGAHGRWGEQPRLGLDDLELRVLEDGQQVARLNSMESHWRSETGGSVRLAGELGPTQLELRADLLGLEEGGTWPVDSAQLSLRSIQPETLRTLGLDGESYLAGSLNLEASLTRREGVLLADATVSRAGEPLVRIDAKIRESLVAGEMKVSPLRLDEVSPAAPSLRVAGTVSARYPLAKNEPTQVSWKALRLSGQPIPDGTVTLAWTESLVKVESLQLTSVEGTVEAHGRYDLESSAGRAQLTVEALQLGSLRLPGQPGGSVSADLRVRVGKNGQLTGGGELGADALQVGTASIGQTRLSLSLDGMLTAPVLHAEGRARRLRVGETQARAARFELTAHAGPTVQLEATLGLRGAGMQELGPAEVRARLRGTLQQAHARVVVDPERGEPSTLELTARRQDEALRVKGSLELAAAPDWQLRAHAAQLDPEGYALHELVLRSGAQRIVARGRLQDERIRASLEIDALKLSPFADWLARPDLEGLVNASVSAQGPLDALHVRADVEVQRLTLDADAPRLRVVTNAEVMPRRSRATLDLRAHDVQGPGHLDVDLTTRWRHRGQLPTDMQALRRAEHTLSVRAERVALSPLRPFVPSVLEPVLGRAYLRADLQGMLKRPQGNLLARVRLPEHAGVGAQELRVQVDLDPEQMTLDARASQQRRTLLQVDAKLQAGPAELTRWAQAPERALNDDFEIEVELQRMRLDELGGGFGALLRAQSLELPLRLSGNVHAWTTRDEVRAEGQVHVKTFNRYIDGRCALRAQSDFAAGLELRDGALQVQADAETHHSGTAQARLEMPLDVRELLKGEPFDVDAAEVHAKASEIALHQVPGLCALDGGTASGELTGRGLGTATPKLTASVDVSSLQIGDSGVLGLTAKLQGRGKGVEAQGDITVNAKSAGRFHARVPWSVSKAGVPALGPETPLQAEIDIDSLPVAPVFELIEAVGQPRGTISAELRVDGTLQRPYPKGWIELEKVSFSIASIAQPLRDMQGRIELDGRSLRIEQLRVEDRGGYVELEGNARYTEAGRATAKLNADVEELPVRRHGTIVGEVTTVVRADARLDPEGDLRVGIVIDGGRIWVTGETGSKVQSLEPMPEIRFATGEDAADAEVEVPVELSRLTMRTDQNLWVMHKDFSVQVGVDLTMVAQPETTMRGSVSLKRGMLTLMGKQFRIGEGAIRFTGDVPPEPYLDIRATHELPAGEDLHVQITGRATSPELTFSGAATTAGEALATLVGLGGTGQAGAAQADASQFAVNLLSGLLSMTARRKYGDWVPILSVQGGQSGIEQVRAGFDMSEHIPAFMDEYARALYIEGVFGQGQNARESYPLGFGVSAEIAWPRNIVTTGSYGPGATWSVDVGWAP